MTRLNRPLVTHLFTLMVACVAYGASALPASAAEPADAILQISAGERHACAITQQGVLYCWGDNERGEIGDGTLGDTQRHPAHAVRRSPTRLFTGGASAVSAGHSHTCAVVNSALYCWGWNSVGQVNGKPSEKPLLTPTLVLAEGVTAVAAGGSHTCAVVRGAALCWGGDETAIGKASYISYASDAPFRPIRLVADGVTAIAARAQSTCAIVRGALHCWGDNRYGQLSPKRTEGFVGPTQLIADGVTAVSVGGNDGTICAVTKGALQCWGKRNDPAAGPNATASVPKPTTVIAQGVTGVSVLGMSGCAVVQDALQCWGYDNHGNLGFGAQTPRVVATPTTVIAGGVSAVAMGDGYTCALVQGALRCRGYNGYGAISVTQGLDGIGDSRPFELATGDVRTLSHAQADAAVAREQLPDQVASFLLAKLIAHEQAVFLVRAASAGYLGRDVRNPIAFHLDVTPLYQTSVTAGASAEMVLAPDAPCGGSNLAARVDTAALRVQHENGFVAVAEAFKAAFTALPQWTPDGDQPPWRVSPNNLRKITSCAKAIHDAWAKEPVQSVSLGGTDIAPSLSRSWNIPGDGEHGEELAMFVTRKAGSKADLFVEAQSVSQMVCDTQALRGWKRGLSAPWKLRADAPADTALAAFYADEALVQAVDMPTFPAFTPEELRRAIHAEQGREGLASADAAKACEPAIVGYQYTLHDGARVVQAVYNPGFTPPPPRGCDQAMPTLALRMADQLGFLRGRQLQSAICKPWPGDASRTIVALVRAQPGSTEDQGSFDLDVAIIKTDSAEILQQAAQPGLITSDAMRFDGIALDTANYTLAPGLRAFGLRTRHIHIGATSASDESLRLYLPQGKRLKPILPELMTGLSVHERGGGGECTESHDMTRTIAIGKPGRQGYADLVVSEQSNRQEVKMRKQTCTEVTSKTNRRYTLPFDGAQYVLPAELNQ